MKKKWLLIQKVYLRFKQEVLIELKERVIEAINNMFEGFYMVITNKEILVLNSVLKPCQKSLLSGGSKYLSTVQISRNHAALIFVNYIMDIKQNKENFTYEKYL